MSEAQKIKKIYFVRHGESTNNIVREDGLIDFKEDSELTENGTEQSKQLAERFRNIKIDKFYSSPYIRARQTADQIKKVIKIDYEIVESAREKSGEHKEGCLSTIYNLDNEGDEDFNSIISRIKELTKIIESTPEENILIVSHGMFLRIFAAYVVFGEKLTPEITETFMKKFMTKNTGIFKFYLFDDNWRIGTWNDDYHL